MYPRGITRPPDFRLSRLRTWRLRPLVLLFLSLPDSASALARAEGRSETPDAGSHAGRRRSFLHQLCIGSEPLRSLGLPHRRRRSLEETPIPAKPSSQAAPRAKRPARGRITLPPSNGGGQPISSAPGGNREPPRAFAPVAPSSACSLRRPGDDRNPLAVLRIPPSPGVI